MTRRGALLGGVASVLALALARLCRWNTQAGNPLVDILGERWHSRVTLDVDCSPAEEIFWVSSSRVATEAELWWYCRFGGEYYGGYVVVESADWEHFPMYAPILRENARVTLDVLNSRSGG